MALSNFFNTSYQQMNYDSYSRNTFIEFIKTTDIGNDDYVFGLLNKVTTGTVGQFIEAYTGENVLCYRLNRWLRNLDSNEYDKVKYFAGPFSYSLYKYAYETACRSNFRMCLHTACNPSSLLFSTYKTTISDMIL